MYCPKCGTQNDDNNFRCVSCQNILHPAPQVVAVTESDGTLGGLIPTKNPPALVAYYLGVFSIIPFLGIPLGIAAFVVGLRGLKRAKEVPEAKGKVHAWVGVLVGGFFGFGYLLATVVLFGMAIVSG